MYCVKKYFSAKIYPAEIIALAHKLPNVIPAWHKKLNGIYCFVFLR